jgi:hypothetical protein
MRLIAAPFVWPFNEDAFRGLVTKGSARPTDQNFFVAPLGRPTAIPTSMTDSASLERQYRQATAD